MQVAHASVVALWMAPLSVSHRTESDVEEMLMSVMSMLNASVELPPAIGRVPAGHVTVA